MISNIRQSVTNADKDDLLRVLLVGDSITRG